MRRKKEADSFFTKVATTEEGFGKTTFAGCHHRNRYPSSTDACSRSEYRDSLTEI
jgi:hypothetical protein